MAPHPCANCKAPTRRRCTGCQLNWYCGMSCQEAHWKTHLFDCKAKDQITTADYLYKTCILDADGQQLTEPHDEQTRKDYGYARARGPDELRNLTQLYFTILHPALFAVKTRTLHEWKTEGVLAQQIISLLESRRGSATLPEWCSWFIENHHWLLDGDREAARAVVKEQWHNTVKAGWWYSGCGHRPPTESQIREMYQSKSWSSRKIDCLEFCGIILCHGEPVPEDHRWVTFGLCVATDREATRRIISLYYALLCMSTFEEFFDAYESSGLLTLLHKYGLGQTHMYPKGFCEIISASPDNIPSVWCLNSPQIAMRNTVKCSMIMAFAIVQPFGSMKI